jgi:hypothetical protein
VPSRKSLVVVNLRAQPVELHYGGEVVVVPEFAHTELPKLPGEEGQLAELARRGAVAVQTVAPEPPAPRSRRKPKPRPAKPKPKPKAKAKPRRRSSTT